MTLLMHLYLELQLSLLLHCKVLLRLISFLCHCSPGFVRVLSGSEVMVTYQQNENLRPWLPSNLTKFLEIYYLLYKYSILQN